MFKLKSTRNTRILSVLVMFFKLMRATFITSVLTKWFLRERAPWPRVSHYRIGNNLFRKQSLLIHVAPKSSVCPQCSICKHWLLYRQCILHYSNNGQWMCFVPYVNSVFSWLNVVIMPITCWDCLSSNILTNICKFTKCKWRRWVAWKK